MKFSMDTMPLEAALNTYFLIPTSSITNMVDPQTCEVGMTLVPLNLGS
jgi:hypothetical protein